MITSKYFGKAASGEDVYEYKLTNENGMEVNIISYAAIVKDIYVPYKDGKLNIVMGYETLEEYEADHESYYGAFVGRYANRILEGKFELNGKTYQLPINEENCHLHGILSFRVFNSKIEGNSVVMSIFSPAGEEGYPGNMTLSVRYELTNENKLKMSYKAMCDEDCPVNLTNHSYFNLNGRGDGEIFNTKMQIPAEFITQDALHPTGTMIPVEGTRYDLRELREIGQGLFDDNFCLANSHDMKLAAYAVGEKTGIELVCTTTQIGIQFYDGRWDCFALETQHYPCSINYKQYPDTVLKAGDVYDETTIYEFKF